MDDKVKEAVKYADGSNKLEDNSLTTVELEQIARDIQSGRSDESFLYSVVKLVKKYEEENTLTREAQSHGKNSRWNIEL